MSENIKKENILLAAILLSAAILITLVGCTSPDQSNSKLLYASKCSSCHRVYQPREYRKDKWQEYVEVYGVSLDAEQKRQILEYLCTP